MKSRKEGRDYLVILDGERFPVKLNRKRTDKALLELEKCFRKAGDILHQLHTDHDEEILRLFEEDIFFSEAWEISDGKSWLLDFSAEDARKLREQLQSADDEIPKEEDILTLADIGFRNGYGSERDIWTKTLRDDDEAEIVEEIIFLDQDIMHRKRTILWEPIRSGRSSKSITYKKLRTGKRLAKICQNTKKEIS